MPRALHRVDFQHASFTLPVVLQPVRRSLLSSLCGDRLGSAKPGRPRKQTRFPRTKEPGHSADSRYGSVSRDDWSFSERKFTDRSFTNRRGWRRRFFEGAPMISKSTEPRRGVPLRVAWDEYERPPFLARAALAYCRHAFDPNQSSGPAEIARRTWPDDQTTLALTIVKGAAVPPTSTTSTSAFSQIGLAEFLASLAPISAAAALFAAAPRVSLGRLSSITFPHRSAALDPSAVDWVDEGAPAIVPRLNIVGGSVLGPTKKLAAVVAVSRELSEASDAESALDLLLRESASLALDASVFSAAA